MRNGFMTVALLFSLTCFADSDDELFQEAVQDTQAKMNSPELRKSLIQTSEAKKANANAEILVGSENIDEIYSLSSQILPTLTKSDDPNEAAKVLEKAQRNPAEFFKSLSPEMQAQIRSLAEKVDNKNSKKVMRASP
jgi:hypothetical protein